MKQIIALQEYTDKFISLYEGEIRNIEDNLAQELIEKGIVAEHNEDSDEGDHDCGVEIVTAKLIEQEPYGQMNFVITNVSHTFEQILDAQNQGKAVFLKAEICTAGASSGMGYVFAYCQTSPSYAEYMNSFRFSALDIDSMTNILQYYLIFISKDLNNNVRVLKYTLSASDK